MLSTRCFLKPCKTSQKSLQWVVTSRDVNLDKNVPFHQTFTSTRNLESCFFHKKNFHSKKVLSDGIQGVKILPSPSIIFSYFSKMTSQTFISCKEISSNYLGFSR